MAAFTWNDLQEAADAAGVTYLVWVVGADGTWEQGHVKATAGWDGGEPLEDHLSREFKTVRIRNTRDAAGRVQSEPWVWVYRHEGADEYAVLVRLNSQTAQDELELVVARGLPAYLRLMTQLREAGLIS